jgi:hypothetical protein
MMIKGFKMLNECAKERRDLNTTDTNHTNPILKKGRWDLGYARDKNGLTREDWLEQDHKYVCRK